MQSARLELRATRSLLQEAIDWGAGGVGGSTESRRANQNTTGVKQSMVVSIRNVDLSVCRSAWKISIG